MKILLLAPHPFYLVRGTPIDLDLLLRALSERGLRVDVVSYRNGTDVDYPGVDIHRIRAPRMLSTERPGFSIRKLWCDVFLFVRAWRLLLNGQYDVVHADEEAVFLAMLFRLLHRVPYVYDMDSSIAQQLVEKLPPLRPLAPLFDALEGLAIRRALAVAPVCNALADIATRRGARHVFVLHDISQLCDEDFETSWRLREQVGIEGPVTIYVGNLEKYQGIDLLLESFRLALARRPDLQLVIAGGLAADVARYRRKAERLGVAARTHWLGPWPTEKLGGLLAQADVLVAPRIRGINTPMKIFPYLHSGRPVLATRLPTHTQLLDDSLLMLAAPEPEAFADAWVRLVDDRELASRLGAAGRRFVLAGHLYAHHRDRVWALYDLIGQSVCEGRHEAPAPG